MIEIIEYKGEKYPLFQTKGFASKYAFPFAKEVCIGNGLDVGCMKKEWSLPGSIPIDITFNEYDEYGKLIEAFNLPGDNYDYIFSSNMLEHVRDWVECIDYWFTKIKDGGTLFLYLPHYDQKYWRSWNNRKHIHNLSTELLKDYLEDRGWEKIFVSGKDLNCCFSIIAQKPFNKLNCGIYRIVNKINNKSYVGSTTVSFTERFRNHRSSLKHNKHHSYLLQRAYDKYGKENFNYEILEDCRELTKEEIYKKEEFYIEKYNSHNSKFGYNVKGSAVGNSVEHVNILILLDLNGNVIREYKNTSEASKDLNISISTIQSSYKLQKKGIHSTLSDKYIIIQKLHVDKLNIEYPYTVHEIDVNGNILNIYHKYADIGKELNISRETVRNIIKYKKITKRDTFLILPYKNYEI